MHILDTPLQTQTLTQACGGGGGGGRGGGGSGGGRGGAPLRWTAPTKGPEVHPYIDPIFFRNVYV